jgi:hypothetical protein
MIDFIKRLKQGERYIRINRKATNGQIWVQCEHESRLGTDKVIDIIPKTKQTSQKTLKNPKNRLRLAIIADIILCNKASIFTQRICEPRGVRFAAQRCVFMFQGKFYIGLTEVLGFYPLYFSPPRLL